MEYYSNWTPKPKNVYRAEGSLSCDKAYAVGDIAWRGARHPEMQHPRHTRMDYYLYFVDITKSVYIHLMSVYYFKMNKKYFNRYFS